MFIGIDLGTSGLKGLVIDDGGQVIASHTEVLQISRPVPLWSEQNPQDWDIALDKVVLALKTKCDFAQISAIGLTGQMHGAVLLDGNQNVLRPAILWNDGRSLAQCRQLEQRVPNAREITGNLMMPGFTAPKLKWVAENEPEIFRSVKKVLLPKDYLRLVITGGYATDMSDAAGTMWLDVGKRQWSDALLEACDLSREHMPQLFEGSEIAGSLSESCAKKWGMKPVPVIAGGGDNAVGAIGVGLHKPGQGMLSLGTSGVCFVVSDGFLSNTEKAVHSFCHALPNTWHLMSVMLSAASCLNWACRLTNTPQVADLIEMASKAPSRSSGVYFLPYLSGERTPHNNPNLKGAFWGLTHDHGAEDLARAVLEGVNFGLTDGMDALAATGLKQEATVLIGGGARSAYWRQMLADVTGRTLEYRKGGDAGPALGAAQLARIASHPHTPLAEILVQPALEDLHIPDSGRHQFYQERLQIFRNLYAQTYV